MVPMSKHRVDFSASVAKESSCRRPAPGVPERLFLAATQIAPNLRKENWQSEGHADCRNTKFEAKACGKKCGCHNCEWKDKNENWRDPRPSRIGVKFRQHSWTPDCHRTIPSNHARCGLENDVLGLLAF